MWQRFLGRHGKRPAPKLSLALQGGGAHGAYTWGVLDRLLEEGWRLEGISGTSAGAMNAVALAQGWMDGGAEGARESLAGFWQAVARHAPAQLDLLQRIDPDGHVILPVSMRAMQSMTKWLSPYQLNPQDINPLRDILRERIDFDRLRTSCPLKLFIATTRVSNGQVRLFGNQELSEAVLLASTCLPSLQQAVEIDGEHYWDGGYTANPAVYPLVYECRTPDILLILLDPLIRERIPRSAGEIAGRSMELGFTTSFLREMRAISQAREYIASSSRDWLLSGRLERSLKRLRFHLIEASDLANMDGISKLNASAGFINRLRDLGRAGAEHWLAAKGAQVGQRPSIEIEHLFT